MENRQLSVSLVYTLIAIIFSVLLSRIFYLQMVEQTELGKISSQNSVRKIPVDPARGDIYDRYGEIVVGSQPRYTVQLTPANFDRKNTQFLSEIVGVPENTLNDLINEGILYNRFAPVKIKRDADFSIINRVEENLWQLTGVELVIENKRRYPDSFRGAHIFGYTKIISKVMLEKLSKEDYSRNDIIGYSGLERTYEEKLKGKKGTKLIMVNSLGKFVSDYNGGNENVPSQNGIDLYTTLDAGLQVVAESLLTATGKSGAIVAIDPRDGGILAMVSKPDYDPNLMEGVIDSKLWESLTTGAAKPLFNRSIQTRYPPGSTYKMISTLAALEEKIAKPSQTFFCSGRFRFGNKEFLCHGGKGHGSVDMTKAIEVSCNSYFYNLMFKIGFENWTKYGRLFGFGRKTGIDIPDEFSAPLPSKEYFDKIYGFRRWTDGYLVSLSIGQGEVGASPMQMAVYTAALANSGLLLKPHFLKGYNDPETGKFISHKIDSTRLPISQSTFDVVRNGMLRCVEYGTAQIAKVPNVQVAGKTGTAQNPHGDDHAWFISFAPYENPSIAIVVMVENAGFGGVVAAPISGEMMKYYFSNRERKEVAPAQNAITSR
ncbi:MAG: penicillin-binding protein 2 [Chloroherpetonaceae bacterium]|nr:penicillin-binding protein 2 [Chloroherpetonaceae bacterium]